MSNSDQAPANPPAASELKELPDEPGVWWRHEKLFQVSRISSNMPNLVATPLISCGYIEESVFVGIGNGNTNGVSKAYIGGWSKAVSESEVAALRAENAKYARFDEAISWAWQSYDAIREHFNDDGTLKGDGKWRLTELNKHAKDLFEQIHKCIGCDARPKADKLTTAEARVKELEALVNKGEVK